ncbi:MAG: hypothetical protein QM767_15475 [Anaeromyxobacter sp.]
MRRPIEPPPIPDGPLFFRRGQAEDLDRVVEIERDGFRHPWSRDLLQRELGHAWSTMLLATATGVDGRAGAGLHRLLAGARRGPHPQRGQRP